MNKNEINFNLHVFIRTFSHATAKLGWIYLFLSGISIELIILSLFTFRFLEIFIFMPISLKLNNKINYKILMFISIILTIIHQYSFYFTTINHKFLLVTIISLALMDVTYWPIRKNLQRQSSTKNNISKNIGINQGIQILAEAGGILFTSYILYQFDELAFIISSVGLLISFIPILFINVKFDTIKDKISFYSLFNYKKLSINKNHFKYIISIIILIAIIDEIIDIFFPLLIAYLDFNILEVGGILGLSFVINFISNIFTGNLENKNKNNAFYIFGISTLLIFILFIFIPNAYISYLFILLGLFLTPFTTSIMCKTQSYIQTYFPNIQGGFILEFLDDFGRMLSYFILFIIFNTSLIDNFKIILISISIITLIMLILIFNIYKKGE